jgi:hypothetical protein
LSWRKSDIKLENFRFEIIKNPSRKEEERLKKLEQERQRNIERIDLENRQQNQRVAILKNSLKKFEGSKMTDFSLESSS